MISFLSHRIALFLRDNEIVDDETSQVCQYGFEIIISTLVGFLLSLWKKVCKKTANCDKIEIITQEADFLWQEGKENRWVRERKIS